eukprot:RCo038739
MIFYRKTSSALPYLLTWLGTLGFVFLLIRTPPRLTSGKSSVICCLNGTQLFSSPGCVGRFSPAAGIRHPCQSYIELARLPRLAHIQTKGAEALPKGIAGLCCLLPNASARSRPRRIYDAFMFSHETLALKLHLDELEPVVDMFIVAESRLTFSGHRKPVLVDQLRSTPEFSRYSKIRHFISHITDEHIVAERRKLPPSEECYRPTMAFEREVM